MCTPWFLFENILIHFWIYIAAISVASSAQVFVHFFKLLLFFYIYTYSYTHIEKQKTPKNTKVKNNKNHRYIFPSQIYKLT